MCRLQERNTMLQAMVDSPEEAEGWDAPQVERPPGTGGSMTSSTLHRILQVPEAKPVTDFLQTCPCCSVMPHFQRFTKY